MRDADTRPSGRWILAGVAGVVAVAATLAGLAWRADHRAHPTVTLPDGSKLVFEGLTTGPSHVLMREPEAWTVIKKVLPPRWRRFTGEPLPPWSIGDAQGGAMGWFSRMDAGRTRYLPTPTELKVASVMEDGLLFPSRGSQGLGSGAGEKGELLHQLGVVDWRADTLRFRVSKDGFHADFQIPNPRRGERFPEWQPRPLPWTNRVAGFDFVLSGLRKFGHDEDPFWMPQWEVSREGVPASPWFAGSWWFHDPTGNVGWKGLPQTEPTWKLVLTAIPTAHFPFPEAQVIHAGRVTLPGPGQFEWMEPGSRGTNVGLRAIAATGAGNYRFQFPAKTVLAHPPGGPRIATSTFINAQEWDIRAEAQEPVVHLLLKGPATRTELLPGPHGRGHVVLRARRPDGTLASCERRGDCWMSDGVQQAAHIPFGFQAKDAGVTVDLDLVVVEPLTAEWWVKCPGSAPAPGSPGRRD